MANVVQRMQLLVKSGIALRRISECRLMVRMDHQTRDTRWVNGASIRRAKLQMGATDRTGIHLSQHAKFSTAILRNDQRVHGTPRRTTSNLLDREHIFDCSQRCGLTQELVQAQQATATIQAPLRPSAGVPRIESQPPSRSVKPEKFLSTTTVRNSINWMPNKLADPALVGFRISGPRAGANHRYTRGISGVRRDQHRSLPSKHDAPQAQDVSETGKHETSSSVMRNGNLNLIPSRRLAYPDLGMSSCSRENEATLTPVSDTLRGSWTTRESMSNGLETTSYVPCANVLPSHGPRGFHIPRYKIEHAGNARAGSVASYWQYTLYQGLEGEKHKVKVHYCKSKEASEWVAQQFVDEEVLGFDIEWMAQARATDSIKRNVSLIQLASEERIALFHIARYAGGTQAEDFVAPTLRRIMESPNVTKVGVGIKGDSTRLRNYLGIDCQGLFELSNLHKLIKYCEGDLDKVDRRIVRLADQVQEHLQLPLLKGDVQVSDWSRDLNHQQAQYAASDSYAGLQLFYAMEAKRKAFRPVPPRPEHAELGLSISLGDQARDLSPVQVVEVPDADDSRHSESVSSSDSSIEELARDYFHIALNDDAESRKSLAMAPVRDVARPKDIPSEKAPPHVVPTPNHEGVFCTTPASSWPQSAQLKKADDFAATYKQPSDRPISTQALRAYALWHEQGLSIDEIAGVLRSPRMHERTVITYLCDVLCVGDVDYEAKDFLEVITKYEYQPFLRVHKDLLERLKDQVPDP